MELWILAFFAFLGGVAGTYLKVWVLTVLMSGLGLFVWKRNPSTEVMACVMIFFIGMWGAYGVLRLLSHEVLVQNILSMLNEIFMR